MLCCTLGVVTGSVASAEDDAAALLAKHRAYVGWQFGDGSFKTLAIDYRISEDGAEVGTAHEMRSGALRRRAEHFGSLTYESGFTGRVFWSTNPNGFAEPVVGDAIKRSISTSVLFDEATTLVPAQLHGSENVDGKPTTILRMVPANGAVLDVYVDPATGAYVRAVVDPDGTRPRTYTIAKYVEAAPGKKIIGDYTIGNRNIVVQKVTPDLPIAPADLHPPAPQATWTFSNAPFPIEYDGTRIVVTAKVNGTEGRFILDTGASAIVLSSAFVARAGLKTYGRFAITGVGNSKASASLARVATLDVGGNVLRNVIVQTGIGEIDAKAPDGLMGYDFLAGAVVSLDLDKKEMTLSDPASAPVDATGAYAVLVDLAAHVPTVPMTIDGRVPLDAVLDSGDPSLVLVSNTYLFKNKVSMMIDASTFGSSQAIGGVSGVDQVQCGRLNSIDLGPIHYSPAPACKARFTSLFSGDTKNALVGLDFLKAFNIVFDYPESKIVLSPRKNPI